MLGDRHGSGGSRQPLNLDEFRKAKPISGLTSDCDSQRSAIRYMLYGRGCIMIAEKYQLMRQLGRSPDLAESLTSVTLNSGPRSDANSRER
jgi:hypothetical protein